MLEDVESLFNDQLRKRRLHAKLLYTDKDFGCEVEVETNLDLRTVLDDLADSWKCGEKASCVLTVRETLTVRREDTPLRISPSEACAKLGDEFSATVLSHASQLGERNDDSDEDKDSDCDIIESDLFPDPPQEKETPAAAPGDVEAVELPAKRTKRSRPRRHARGKDGKVPPVPLHEKTLAFKTKLAAICGVEGATLIDSKRVRCEKCKSTIQLGKDFDVSNFKKHMARCFFRCSGEDSAAKGADGPQADVACCSEKVQGGSQPGRDSGQKQG